MMAIYHAYWWVVVGVFRVFFGSGWHVAGPAMLKSLLEKKGSRKEVRPVIVWSFMWWGAA